MRQLFMMVSCGLVLAAGSRLSASDNPTLIGKTAPNFTLRDLAGQEVSLQQFKGQPILLAFWGAGCPPCCAEALHLSAFQQKYAARGLVVLGIDVWNSPAVEVVRFVKAKKLSYRILLEGESVARKKYNLGPVPTTFWIDKQGEIVHQTFGFNEKELKVMEVWIKKIIAN